MTTVALDFVEREPDGDYRRKAKDHLSSHALADFRKCPLLYRKKQLGLILDEDSPAFLLGRAAHSLILEGRSEFQKTFAVGGPVNEKTGKPFGRETKAFTEWAEALGKPVLTHDQMALIEAMASGVEMNDTALDLLISGIPEGVVRIPYCGLPCQSRMDWFNPRKGIVDLKTCDDLTWFESDARRFGYAHQMAFYRSLLREASGESFPIHVIAVEKREPFRCGVWRVGEDLLGVAQRENEEAISRLKQCVKTGSWPTGFEDIRQFDWI